MKGKKKNIIKKGKYEPKASKKDTLFQKAVKANGLAQFFYDKDGTLQGATIVETPS